MCRQDLWLSELSPGSISYVRDGVILHRLLQASTDHRSRIVAASVAATALEIFTRCERFV